MIRSKRQKANDIGKLVFLFLLCITLLISCNKEEEKTVIDISKLSDEYLGEAFPFDQAQVFLDGLVEEKYSIQNIVFSRNGKEFYYTRTTLDNDSATIFVSSLQNDFWTSPEPVSFTTEYNESDPFITYDNQRLFFISDRPSPDEEESNFDYNIWFVERTDNGWSESKFLSGVNSLDDEYSPSLTENETIFFSSSRQDADGYWDIYKSELINGEYTEAKKVDLPINSQYGDFDPFISKDGNKILFVSDRPNSYGGGDIYFCEKDENGKWQQAVNLGIKVNTNDYEYSPKISYDGNFLFYTRLLPSEENIYRDKALDTRDPFQYIYLEEEGRSLVYWMFVDSLDSVKF